MNVQLWDNISRVRSGIFDFSLEGDGLANLYNRSESLYGRKRRLGVAQTIAERAVVGTIEQFKTEAEAREIVEGIVSEINSGDPRLRTSVLTMSQLIEHYRRRELAVDNSWKSYATKMGYENYQKRWIAPRWGSYPLTKIKPIEVESWLRQLPLARG